MSGQSMEKLKRHFRDCSFVAAPYSEADLTSKDRDMIIAILDDTEMRANKSFHRSLDDKDFFDKATKFLGVIPSLARWTKSQCEAYNKTEVKGYTKSMLSTLEKKNRLLADKNLEFFIPQEEIRKLSEENSKLIKWIENGQAALLHDDDPLHIDQIVVFGDPMTAIYKRLLMMSEQTFCSEKRDLVRNILNTEPMLSFFEMDGTRAFESKSLRKYLKN